MPNREFELLIDRKISKPALRVEFDPADVARFSADIEAEIDRRWRRRLAEGGSPDDGTIFRLAGVHRDQDSVVLRLQTSQYRHYVGTRCPELALRHGRWSLGNPLAVAVVAVTSDGFILMEQRAPEVSYEGRLHVVGGYIGAADLVDGAPDPVHAIQREFREEIGWAPAGDLLVMTGLAYDTCLPHPELCFSTRLPITALEVAKYAASDSDREFLPLFLPADRETVADLLRRQSPWIVPTGNASLLLHGRHEFGEKWYCELEPEY